MDLTFAQDRLTKEFAGICTVETVTEFLEDSATDLSREARIMSYIPILAERAARERLKAMLNKEASSPDPLL
jgi:arsenate reductase